ncbi:hypothetical protein IWQ61_010427 [Dispira simplex]|nr:hypothetical protein IWQ61_010427 [Dispira simplex]
MRISILTIAPLVLTALLATVGANDIDDELKAHNLLQVAANLHWNFPNFLRIPDTVINQIIYHPRVFFHILKLSMDARNDPDKYTNIAKFLDSLCGRAYMISIMRRSKGSITLIFNEEVKEVILFFAKTFGGATYHRFFLDDNLRKYIFSKNMALEILKFIKRVNGVVSDNKITKFLSSPIGKELVKELAEISDNDYGTISNREAKTGLLLLVKLHHYGSDKIFTLDKEIWKHLYSKKMAVKILEIIDNVDGMFNLGVVMDFLNSADGQNFKKYLDILSADDDSNISDEEVEDMLLLFAGLFGFISSRPTDLMDMMPRIPRGLARRIFGVINHKKVFNREEITSFLTSHTGRLFKQNLEKVTMVDNGAKFKNRLPEEEHATMKVTLLPLFFVLDKDKNWFMDNDELHKAVSFLEEASNPDDDTHV